MGVYVYMVVSSRFIFLKARGITVCTVFIVQVLLLNVRIRDFSPLKLFVYIYECM